MQILDRDDYAPYINTNFITTFSPNMTVELRLMEVTPVKVFGGIRSYSLVFMGHPDTPPEQRLYDLKHQQLGEVSMFLAPVGIDASKTLFEAVFNRLV